MNKNLDLICEQLKKFSCTKKKYDLVHWITLIKKHKNVNAFDHKGRTALIYAVEQKDIVLTKLFIEVGVNINLPGLGYCEETPLACASKSGHVELVQILIDAGADPNIESEDLYDTPLMRAAEHRHVDVVKTLIDAGAHINKGNAKEVSTLMYAVHGGNKDIIKMLIQAGAHITASDVYGRTAYDMTQDQEILKMLRDAESATFKNQKKIA